MTGPPTLCAGELLAEKARLKAAIDRIEATINKDPDSWSVPPGFAVMKHSLQS